MNAAPAAADPNQTRLLQAQLAAMYAVYPGAFAISMAASVFYAGFYWWLHHDVWIFVWLLMRLPSVLIYRQLSRYARDPDTAAHSVHWLHLFLWGFAYHGLVWGVLPWFFMPVEQPTAAVLNALVLLSLITGGLPGVAHRWSAVLVFVLPINLSLFLALLVGSPHAIWYLFLAIGVLLHLVITLHGARAQHRLLTESLRMRFANEDLSAQLREQVAETERLSREKTRFFAAASHDLRQPPSRCSVPCSTRPSKGAASIRMPSASWAPCRPWANRWTRCSTSRGSMPA